MDVLVFCVCVWVYSFAVHTEGMHWQLVCVFFLFSGEIKITHHAGVGGGVAQCVNIVCVQRDTVLLEIESLYRVSH